jgi:hypothetical protein
MNLHQDYDYCRSFVDLLYCICSTFLKNGNWELKLKEYLRIEQDHLPLAIADTIKKYGPITLAQTEFIKKLQNECMQTAYPTEILADMLKKINVII